MTDKFDEAFDAFMKQHGEIKLARSIAADCLDYKGARDLMRLAYLRGAADGIGMAIETVKATP